MGKYYMPDGSVTSKEKFIEFYNYCYYLNNSKNTEDYIDNLLNKGIKTQEEAFRILAWKFGKIDHKKSNYLQKFEYEKNTSFIKKKLITEYGKNVGDKEGSDIERLLEKMIELSQKYTGSNIAEIVEELQNININNIGTVYLITMLYFITKGEYPIYDRFAQMALIGIKEDKKIGEPIKCPKLPEKDKLNQILDENGSYLQYKKNLEELGYSKDDRALDRALWVYGHLFEEAK